MGKWVGKALWHSYLKHIHHYCKFLANQVVPISAHSSNSSRGNTCVEATSRNTRFSCTGPLGMKGPVILGPLARNPIGFVAHWGIYLILLAVFYIVSLGAIGFLIPPLNPWVTQTTGYLFHLLLVQMPLWVFFQALHTTWLAVILGVGLLWFIKKNLEPHPVLLILLAALLVLAYHYQDYWVASVPKPQVEGRGLIVPIPKEGIGSPVPKPQVDLSPVAPAKGEGRGLIVPIPKEGIDSPVPKPQVDLSPVAPAKGEGRGLNVPISKPLDQAQGVPDIGTSTQGNEITVPDDLKGRTAIDSSIAMEFTTNFYEVSYDVPSHELKTLDEYTNDHYTKAFFKEFFPPSKLKDIRSKKLNTVFQTSGPVKLLKLDKDSCEFLVEGVVTTLSDKRKKNQFVSERPVGLIIDIDDRPTANGAVVKVRETIPAPNP